MTTDQRCTERWRYIDGKFGQRCILPTHAAGTLHEADFGDGPRYWQTEASATDQPVRFLLDRLKAAESRIRELELAGA